jgi:SagB-type dehydrogenase family enzyme
VTSAERLRAYHERTKHSFESIRSNAHYMDWENEPSRFKRFSDLPTQPLPPPSGLRLPCHRALRASALPTGTEVLDLAGLADLLHNSAGVSRTVRTPLGEFNFRTHASAGALYPIEAYMVAGNVDGLPPGAYHYAPLEHGLTQLRDGDVRGNLGLAGLDPGVAVIVLTGIPWRTAWKYTARGFRHLYWDAGMMLANLLATAAALNVAAAVVLGFVDATVEKLLGLDGRTEFPICLVTLGEGREPPPAEVAPISPRVDPLSARPRSDPEIEEAHETIRLGAEADVRAFRAAGPVGSPGTGSDLLVAPLPEQALSSDGLDEVIRRRGSSRRLAGEPFLGAEYAAILDAAIAGVSSDWSSVGIRPFVIASALEGLSPGVHEYLGEGRFRVVREGRFRPEAGHLCLDQRLAADAAVATFLMADLDRCLSRLGGRGYAAAQLEAAVIAGRMYLGAYAQCLGASGITFYDDEVSDFLETDAEPMLAVVMGPEGRRRSIRRCRERRLPTAQTASKPG